MAISHKCSNNIVPSDIRRMFDGEWDWYDLSTVIPLVDVRKNPNLPWDETGLSLNHTLTVDDIQSLTEIDGYWDWDVVPEFQL